MMQAPVDSALAVYIRATNGSVIDTEVVYLDVTQHATQITHTYSQQVQNALDLTAKNAPLDELASSIGIAVCAMSYRYNVSFGCGTRYAGISDPGMGVTTISALFIITLLLPSDLNRLLIYGKLIFALRPAVPCKYITLSDTLVLFLAFCAERFNAFCTCCE